MIKPSFIAFMSGFMPALTVHVTYIIAANHGHVPWGFPYLDGCTSISATGREAPEFYVFKALMIPGAMVMIYYWQLAFHWLISLGDQPLWRVKWMLWCGIAAALFLILYSSALGAIGDAYKVQRRIGVIFFFTLTYVAHVLMTNRLLYLKKIKRLNLSQWIVSGYLFIVTVMLALGIVSALLSLFYEKYDDIEDAFEWNFALLIVIPYFLSYLAWKKTNFKLSYSVSNS